MSRPRSVTIQEIVAAPMSELRFRDFANLKVGGRDRFTPLRLAELRRLVTDSHILDAALDHDESAVASCLRWMLRGLPIEKAVRKVRTDLEIAEQARLKSVTSITGCRWATIFPALSQLRSVFGDTPRYSAASEIRRKSRRFSTDILLGSGRGHGDTQPA